MGFKKGEGGRKRGALNKTTTEIRTAITAIVEGAMPDFVAVLGEMRESNPVKYAENIRALMEYTTPKLRAVDNTHEMSDETLQGIHIMFGPKKNNE